MWLEGAIIIASWEIWFKKEGAYPKMEFGSDYTRPLIDFIINYKVY